MAIAGAGQRQARRLSTAVCMNERDVPFALTGAPKLMHPALVASKWHFA
jgi:hypothetical protein